MRIDYAGQLKGYYYYLVIVDSFSKWPKIYRCKHSTARNTIKALDEVFSRFGVPYTVVSDKETMFTGKEFKDNCYSLAIVTDKMKHSFFQAAVVSILLYGCTTWTLTKRMEKKLDGNYTRILRAILNKSWRKHPTRTNCTATYLPSWKLSKLDEPDMQETAGEAGTSS